MPELRTVNVAVYPELKGDLAAVVPPSGVTLTA
jgi:hypothetical protein